MVEEFRQYSIDPGLVNSDALFQSISMLQQTINLQTTTSVKMANSALASIYQVVFFKIARAEYYYERLNEEADVIFNARKAAIIQTDPGLAATKLDVMAATNGDVVAI